jgi:alanyl aminopeptidase
VRPVAYRLEVEVDPSADRFRGHVAIEVEVVRAAPVVWLHARDLEVARVRVTAGEAEVPAAFAQVTREGVARLAPERPLPPGRATLELTFSGAWNEQLQGLYRVRRRGRAYAVTQLEAIGARRLFPCLDDPGFKAPFEVALVVPRGLVAVSNGPQASREPAGPGRERVRFARTPPLPTYLLFLGVGPFDVVEPPPLPPNEVRGRPLALRGLAPAGEGPRMAALLEATAAVVPALERWFGTPFPYEKLDSIIAPDFAFGGMENAGAIAYFDLALADPAHLSGPARRRLEGLAAHEVGHQWFGDDVTLPWWEEIWLNESFATWIERRALDAARPDPGRALRWRARVERRTRADELAGARAVRQRLARMSDISGMFDGLTYEKGAAVLDMFERYAGPERFREGIRAWLRAHAGGTGDTDGLLAAISAAAGRDLAGPMATFLDQPGLPLVEARVDCGGGRARLLLVQSRFLPLGSRAERARRWRIPVCARIGAGGAVSGACALLEEERGELPLPACPEWVMPDAGGAGYYRWSLPPRDLERLFARGLERLTPVERLAAGSAVAAAARAGEVPFAEALRLLEPLARDPADEVAAVPLDALETALERLLPQEARPAARARAAALYRARWAALGWEPAPAEPDGRAALRAELLRFLADVARDPEVRREAAARGRAFANPGGAELRRDALAPELAPWGLAVAVEEGDAAFFDAVEARLHASESGEDRTTLLGALAAARAPDLSDRALALSGDPRLRASERGAPLYGFWRSRVPGQASRPETRERALRFVQERIDPLLERLGRGGDLHLLPAAFAGFCEPGRAAELRALFEPRLAAHPELAKGLAEAVERIELCAALREGQGRSAAGWFAAGSGRRPSQRPSVGLFP